MFATEKHKLIAAGLALTLFGGVVGAYTTRPKTTAETSPVPATAPQTPVTAAQPVTQPGTQPGTQPQVPQNPDGQVTVIQLPPGQAYQIIPVGGTQVVPTSTVAPAPRQSSRSSRTSARTSPQRTYYTYDEAPKKRSFWNRHRDILTVGIGTGLGAAVGGLAGGKKGAAIGALAGGGGSALYTYGLRKRN